MSVDTSSQSPLSAPWLLPERDGVNCRSHCAILASMVGYNTVAILIYLLLNSPPLHHRLKTAQSARWTMLRRAVGKPPKETVDTPETRTTAFSSPEEQTGVEGLGRTFYASGLPLLIVGHMLIT